jgi:hypothetical protein
MAIARAGQKTDRRFRTKILLLGVDRMIEVVRMRGFPRERGVKERGRRQGAVRRVDVETGSKGSGAEKGS